MRWQACFRPPLLLLLLMARGFNGIGIGAHRLLNEVVSLSQPHLIVFNFLDLTNFT